MHLGIALLDPGAVPVPHIQGVGACVQPQLALKLTAIHKTCCKTYMSSSDTKVKVKYRRSSLSNSLQHIKHAAKLTCQAAIKARVQTQHSLKFTGKHKEHAAKLTLE